MHSSSGYIGSNPLKRLPDITTIEKKERTFTTAELVDFKLFLYFTYTAYNRVFLIKKIFVAMWKTPIGYHWNPWFMVIVTYILGVAIKKNKTNAVIYM